MHRQEMHWTKKNTALAAFVGLLAFQVSAAELHWLTDLPKAQEQAGKEKKMVFMDFIGSDWDPWSMKLKRELFDTKEFADYAAKNLVLVEVDFPGRKQLSVEQQKANEALQNKYRAEGFPTVVLLNSAGKEVWRQTGYLPGGPKAWIAKLDAARKK